MSDNGLFGHLTMLQHVNLPTTDLAVAREFYIEKLGLPELPRPDFGVPGVWVGAGPKHAIHILEVFAVGSNANNHFALEVERLDELLRRLTARGVEHNRARHTPGAGHQAFIRDPDGNVIELIQPPG